MRRFKKSWCTRLVGYGSSALPLRKSCRLLCLRNCASAWRTNFQRQETRRLLPFKWPIRPFLRIYCRPTIVRSLRMALARVKALRGFTKTCRCARKARNWSSQGLLRLIQSIFVRIIYQILPSSWKPLVFRISPVEWSLMMRWQSKKWLALSRKMKRSSKRPMKRPCGLWNPWPRWLHHQQLKKSQFLTSRPRRRRLNPS